MKMRAKFKIEAVTVREHHDELILSAVSAGNYGPKGESEDNTFARYTPTANLTMTITNPELRGQFKPGTAYYLDFTPAE